MDSKNTHPLTHIHTHSRTNTKKQLL